MKFKDLEEEKEYEQNLDKGGSVSFKFKYQQRVEKEEPVVSFKKESFITRMERVSFSLFYI